jgi:hypothetical protein
VLNLLAEWVPDAATRKKILVDNPKRLYEFFSALLTAKILRRRLTAQLICSIFVHGDSVGACRGHSCQVAI